MVNVNTESSLQKYIDYVNYVNDLMRDAIEKKSLPTLIDFTTFYLDKILPKQADYSSVRLRNYINKYLYYIMLTPKTNENDPMGIGVKPAIGRSKMEVEIDQGATLGKGEIVKTQFLAKNGDVVHMFAEWLFTDYLKEYKQVDLDTLRFMDKYYPIPRSFMELCHRVYIDHLVDRTCAVGWDKKLNTLALYINRRFVLSFGLFSALYSYPVAHSNLYKYVRDYTLLTPYTAMLYVHEMHHIMRSHLPACGDLFSSIDSQFGHYYANVVEDMRINCDIDSSFRSYFPNSHVMSAWDMGGLRGGMSFLELYLGFNRLFNMSIRKDQLVPLLSRLADLNTNKGIDLTALDAIGEYLNKYKEYKLMIMYNFRAYGDYKGSILQEAFALQNLYKYLKDELGLKEPEQPEQPDGEGGTDGDGVDKEGEGKGGGGTGGNTQEPGGKGSGKGKGGGSGKGPGKGKGGGGGQISDIDPGDIDIDDIVINDDPLNETNQGKNPIDIGKLSPEVREKIKKKIEEVLKRKKENGEIESTEDIEEFLKKQVGVPDGEDPEGKDKTEEDSTKSDSKEGGEESDEDSSIKGKSGSTAPASYTMLLSNDLPTIQEMIARDRRSGALWKQKLRMVIDMATGLRQEYNTSLLSKRYTSGGGLVAYGRFVERPAFKNAIISLDYSGSMGTREYKACLLALSELFTLREYYNHLADCTFHLVGWSDDVVHRRVKGKALLRNRKAIYQQFLSIEGQISKGGTSFYKCHDLLFQKVRQFDFIIVMTDFGFSSADAEKYTGVQHIIRRNRNKFVWVCTYQAGRGMETFRAHTGPLPKLDPRWKMRFIELPRPTV